MNRLCTTRCIRRGRVGDGTTTLTLPAQWKGSTLNKTHTAVNELTWVHVAGAPGIVISGIRSGITVGLIEHCGSPGYRVTTSDGVTLGPFDELEAAQEALADRYRS